MTLACSKASDWVPVVCRLRVPRSQRTDRSCYWYGLTRHSWKDLNETANDRLNPSPNGFLFALIVNFSLSLFGTSDLRNSTTASKLWSHIIVISVVGGSKTAFFALIVKCQWHAIGMPFYDHAILRSWHCTDFRFTFLKYNVGTWQCRGCIKHTALFDSLND